MAHMWTCGGNKDDLQESVLSSTQDPGVELRSPGLVAGVLMSHLISTSLLILKEQTQLKDPWDADGECSKGRSMALMEKIHLLTKAGNAYYLGQLSKATAHTELENAQPWLQEEHRVTLLQASAHTNFIKS